MYTSTRKKGVRYHSRNPDKECRHLESIPRLPPKTNQLEHYAANNNNRREIHNLHPTGEYKWTGFVCVSQSCTCIHTYIHLCGASGELSTLSMQVHHVV